jgi:hypothetical protein
MEPDGHFAARCSRQVNVSVPSDPSLHAGVRKVLRQAWDSPSVEQAERVLGNLARRFVRHIPIGGIGNLGPGGR